MPPTVTVHPLPGYGSPPDRDADRWDQLELALPVLRAEAEDAADEAAAGEQLPPGSTTLEEAAARLGAHAVLRLILEVLDGRRPIAHLDRAVSPKVHAYLAAAVSVEQRVRVRRRSGAAAPGKIRTIHLQQPRMGVAEVSAVWQRSGRIAALAARFELDEDARPLGWRCTVLRLG